MADEVGVVLAPAELAAAPEAGAAMWRGEEVRRREWKASGRARRVVGVCRRVLSMYQTVLVSLMQHEDERG